MQGTLAKSKHSSFHHIAAAMAVLLPVPWPVRTETRASGSAIAFSKSALLPCRIQTKSLLRVQHGMFAP